MLACLHVRVRSQVLGINHLSCGPVFRSIQESCDKAVTRMEMSATRMVVREVVHGPQGQQAQAQQAAAPAAPAGSGAAQQLQTQTQRQQVVLAQAEPASLDVGDEGEERPLLQGSSKNRASSNGGGAEAPAAIHRLLASSSTGLHHHHQQEGLNPEEETADASRLLRATPGGAGKAGAGA